MEEPLLVEKSSSEVFAHPFTIGSLVIHAEYQDAILEVIGVKGNHLLLKHIREDLTYAYWDLSFKFIFANDHEIERYFKKYGLKK